MKVIILAAGKGSRLKEITETTPKPLIKISKNKTILDFILESLPQNVDEVFILVKHLKEKFYDFQKENQKKYKFKINIIEHILEKGTFTTLLNLKKQFENEKEKFLVLNGDDIHQKNEIENFIKLDWAISVAQKKMPQQYITFELDKNDFLMKTRPQTEKELKTGCWIASGMYILNKDIFNLEPVYISNGETSLPAVLFNHRDKKGLRVYKEKKWLTINTQDDLKEVQEKIQN